MIGINFFQADLFEIDFLEKKYDLIQCSGVLHHTSDPLAGLKSIKSKLSSHGVIQLGLYSRLARFDLNKVNDTIILFPDYDFNNPLKETEDSMKDIYGDVKRITFALMTKVLTEREILEKLYYATNGPNWVNNNNWLSDKPLKDWYGIGVNKDSDEKFIVNELYLHNNN